jgi:hypothetical protein
MIVTTGGKFSNVAEVVTPDHDPLNGTLVAPLIGAVTIAITNTAVTNRIARIKHLDFVAGVTIDGPRMLTRDWRNGGSLADDHALEGSNQYATHNYKADIPCPHDCFCSSACGVR